jgi:hypothetical protein
LSNSGAQLSRIDIRPLAEGSDDEDEYEIVGRNGSTGEGDRRERNNPGTLSAKAGIILVRVPLLLIYLCDINIETNLYSIHEIGNPQHFHCHTPVPRHRFRCYLVCISRPQETCPSYTSSPCGSGSRSCQWHRPAGRQCHDGLVIKRKRDPWERVSR